jgi:hypothetical protein
LGGELPFQAVQLSRVRVQTKQGTSIEGLGAVFFTPFANGSIELE